MVLSKDLVERFQALYLQRNGVVIDYNEAEYQLKNLAELVRLTSQMQEDVRHA